MYCAKSFVTRCAAKFLPMKPHPTKNIICNVINDVFAVVSHLNKNAGNIMKKKNGIRIKQLK